MPPATTPVPTPDPRPDLPADPPPAGPAAAHARRLRRHRGALLAGAAVLAAVLGWQLTLQRLQAAVVQALGPRASLERIEVGLAAVELHGLRLRGDRAAGWPEDDEARAQRVRLVPDWRSLLDGLRGRPWRLQSVQVEGAHLALLRGADGRLRLLPGLLGAQPAAAPGAANAPRVEIGQLRVSDTTLALHDASVRRPPHRLQLAGLQAEAGPLTLPAAAGTGPMQLALQGRLLGPQHAGNLSLRGTLDLARHDATLQARLQGVDLLALQPYLLKAGEGGVRAGRLDLQLDATVRRQRLNAPGVLTLTGLDLSGGDGLAGRIAGVPRQAVLATLQRDGRITLKFTLAGRLDDPGFSLNENLARRVAGGMAEAVGVSLSGMVEGVGGLFKGLLGR